MTAILAAMDREIAEITSSIEAPELQSWAGRDFRLGNLIGESVVVGYTGVGKALAAMVTQGVIDRHHPDAIFYFGIGGALSEGFEVGDVVIARDCVQHDMDATDFGFRRGEIPGEKLVSVPCSTELARIASEWQPRGRRVHVGRILTGDQFISTPLTTELQGDVVDMEGAAAALVAHLNDVPFLLVRIISDRADGSLPPEFKTLVSEASKAFRELTEHLIQNSPP